MNPGTAHSRRGPGVLRWFAALFRRDAGEGAPPPAPAPVDPAAVETDALERVPAETLQRHLAAGAPRHWLEKVARHAPSLLEAGAAPTALEPDRWPRARIVAPPVRSSPPREPAAPDTGLPRASASRAVAGGLARDEIDAPAADGSARAQAPSAPPSERVPMTFLPTPAARAPQAHAAVNSERPPRARDDAAPRAPELPQRRRPPQVDIPFAGERSAAERRAPGPPAPEARLVPATPPMPSPAIAPRSEDSAEPLAPGTEAPEQRLHTEAVALRRAPRTLDPVVERPVRPRRVPEPLVVRPRRAAPHSAPAAPPRARQMSVADPVPHVELRPRVRAIGVPAPQARAPQQAQPAADGEEHIRRDLPPRAPAVSPPLHRDPPLQPAASLPDPWPSLGIGAAPPGESVGGTLQRHRARIASMDDEQRRLVWSASRS